MSKISKSGQGHHSVYSVPPPKGRCPAPFVCILKRTGQGTDLSVNKIGDGRDPALGRECVRQGGRQQSLNIEAKGDTIVPDTASYIRG